MKTITQRLMKVLLVTLMMIIPLGINNSVVYAEDNPAKELKVGGIYYIDDKMVVLNENPAYIQTDSESYPIKIYDSYHDYGRPAVFIVPMPQYESEHGWYSFYDMFTDEAYDSFSLYLNSEELDESETVIGIKCVSGDGTQSNPFTFELVFKKELAEGVEYLIGDTIQLSANAYIITDDENPFASPDEIKNGDYTLNKPNFMPSYEQYEFINLFVDPEEYNFSLYLGYDTGLTGSETVTGIRCKGGNGKDDNPFVFELIFDNTPSTEPTVIDEITFTITPPVAGIEVSGIGNNQNPYPQVSISDNASYKLGRNESSLPAIWIKEDASSFEGIFEAGEYYYAGVWVRPNEGYKFNKDIGQKDINITNGKCESISKFYDDDGEIILIGIVVKVQCPSEPNYQFTQGNQTYYKGSNKDTEFIINKKTDKDTIDDSFDKFSEFVIEDKDGKEIKLKDTDYEVTSGSVKITLKSSFLESLDLGTYKITAFFNDGHQVTSNLTIARQSSKPSYSIPKTGVE